MEDTKVVIPEWTPDVQLPSEGLNRPELVNITVQDFDPDLGEVEMFEQMKGAVSSAIQSDENFKASMRQVVLSYGSHMIHSICAGNWISGVLSLPKDRKMKFAEANDIKDDHGAYKLNQTTLGKHMGLSQSLVSRLKRASDKVESLYKGNVKLAIECGQSIDSLSDKQVEKAKVKAEGDTPKAKVKANKTSDDTEDEPTDEPTDPDNGVIPPDPDPEVAPENGDDATDSNAAGHVPPKFMGLDDLTPEQWKSFRCGLNDYIEREQEIVDDFPVKCDGKQLDEKADTIGGLIVWRAIQAKAEEHEGKVPMLLGLS